MAPPIRAVDFFFFVAMRVRGRHTYRDVTVDNGYRVGQVFFLVKLSSTHSKANVTRRERSDPFGTQHVRSRKHGARLGSVSHGKGR